MYACIMYIHVKYFAFVCVACHGANGIHLHAGTASTVAHASANDSVGLQVTFVRLIWREEGSAKESRRESNHLTATFLDERQI
jgi:hypothetical protein